MIEHLLEAIKDVLIGDEGIEISGEVFPIASGPVDQL